MSDKGDSLWVIAVIAVVVLAVPIVMIGFPAEEQVEVVIDCDIVPADTWDAFSGAMKVKGWSVVTGGTGQYLSKDFKGSMDIQKFFISVYGDVASVSSGSYSILPRIPASPGHMSPPSTVAEFVEMGGSISVVAGTP